MKLDAYGTRPEVVREDEVVPYLEDLLHEEATAENPRIKILERNAK